MYSYIFQYNPKRVYRRAVSEKGFRKRFSYTFPVFTLLVAGLLVYSSFSIRNFEVENGAKLGPIKRYNEIQIPAELDCSTIKNGRFETQNYFIQRDGTFQVQTYKTTGERLVYKVTWLSDCEYQLQQKDKGFILKCKVVMVSLEGYECYITEEDYGIASNVYLKKVVEQL